MTRARHQPVDDRFRADRPILIDGEAAGTLDVEEAQPHAFAAGDETQFGVIAEPLSPLPLMCARLAWDRAHYGSIGHRDAKGLVFSIGDNLRDARLRQGLDLAEIERRTKIRARLLAALEEEQFELIPGEAYAKGFLRTYAETLGLDSRPFLHEYNERFSDGDDHAIVPLEEVGATRRRLLPRPPLRAVLVVLAAALAVILVAASLHGGGPQKPSRSVGARPHGRAAAVVRPSRPRASPSQDRPARKLPTLVTVPLHSVSAWDPDGDGHEHDDEVALATDSNPATFWRTETYFGGLRKPGVGLVIATPSPSRLVRLTLTTDTPGYTALVEAGSSPTGPFAPISGSRQVAATTSFALRGRAARYYLLWITRLQQVAHVDELRAFRHG